MKLVFNQEVEAQHESEVKRRNKLLNIFSCQPITTKIKNRKWRWIGHTLRNEDTDIGKMALEWNPQGTRRRGRPRMTWMRSTHVEYQDRY